MKVEGIQGLFKLRVNMISMDTLHNKFLLTDSNCCV